MNKKANEARNAYRREWYAKNKDKQKEYAARYWTKKAKEMETAKANQGTTEAPAAD